MLETDRSKGALTDEQCRAIIATPKEDGTTWFTEPKYRAGTAFYLEDQAAIWREEWEQPELKMPNSEEVANAIFKQPPINW